MKLEEQVNKAILNLKALFKDSEPVKPALADRYLKFDKPPPQATTESLWKELQEMAVLLPTQKKPTKHPTVELCVKTILEDPDLPQITPKQVAEIVREVFLIYGLTCNCKESSIRWYQSQRAMSWNIIRRKPYK